jgi:hypothetical protein
MSFDNFVDQMELWRDCYEKHHPPQEPSPSAKQQPETLIVKSIQRVPAVGEALDLMQRVRGGPSRRDFEKFAKSLDQPVASAKAPARSESDQREAQAAWLQGKIAELDRCISAKTVTAEQAAIVENRIHHTAKRLGLV